MKRFVLSVLAAAFVSLGAAAVATADDIAVRPPTYTPATTCMNCK